MLRFKELYFLTLAGFIKILINHEEEINMSNRENEIIMINVKG